HWRSAPLHPRPQKSLMVRRRDRRARTERSGSVGVIRLPSALPLFCRRQKHPPRKQASAPSAVPLRPPRQSVAKPRLPNERRPREQERPEAVPTTHPVTNSLLLVLPVPRLPLGDPLDRLLHA